MQNDLVSIVIPCFNDGQYIEQAVASALNQTYPNIEVIVVDDGSDKETKAEIQRLAPTITKLITQENQGQSKARNVGIEASNGFYILVLDSDDYFEPTFCEKALEIFSNNEDVKLVTCQANLLHSDGSESVYTPRGGTIEDFIITNHALGTSLFKKADWDTSGGYDESMRQGFEDWEFFIRILKNGGYCEVILEPLYNYRKRSNTTTSKANKIKHQLLKYIYTKHQALYISHFDLIVAHLLQKIEAEEREKLKNTERTEFIIGKNILKPLRWIKSMLK